MFLKVFWPCYLWMLSLIEGVGGNWTSNSTSHDHATSGIWGFVIFLFCINSVTTLILYHILFTNYIFMFLSLFSWIPMVSKVWLRFETMGKISQIFNLTKLNIYILSQIPFLEIFSQVFLNLFWVSKSIWSSNR
jgi:hypothetical protein